MGQNQPLAHEGWDATDGTMKPGEIVGQRAIKSKLAFSRAASLPSCLSFPSSSPFAPPRPRPLPCPSVCLWWLLRNITKESPHQRTGEPSGRRWPKIWERDEGKERTTRDGELGERAEVGWDNGVRDVETKNGGRDRERRDAGGERGGKRDREGQTMNSGKKSQDI